MGSLWRLLVCQNAAFAVFAGNRESGFWNLIISSTVRMRLCSRIRLRLGASSISFGQLYFECLAQRLPFPGELAILRQSQLHEHAADVLRQ